MSEVINVGVMNVGQSFQNNVNFRLIYKNGALRLTSTD